MVTKRSQRMAVVQKVVDDQERRRARALAASEKLVLDSEAKLAELEKYRAGYLRDFSSKAGGGMSAASARDYQVFLARLDEALRQQAQIVARAKAQRAGSGAARRRGRSHGAGLGHRRPQGARAARAERIRRILAAQPSERSASAWLLSQSPLLRRPRR